MGDPDTCAVPAVWAVWPPVHTGPPSPATPHFRMKTLKLSELASGAPMHISQPPRLPGHPTFAHLDSREVCVCLCPGFSYLVSVRPVSPALSYPLVVRNLKLALFEVCSGYPCCTPVWGPVSVSQGHCNKRPQCSGLKQQDFILSPFWSLEA